MYWILRKCVASEYTIRSLFPLISIISINDYFQELEKKFSQTGAYKNLKKMLAQKNQQIKELRSQLKGKQEDGEDDAENAEEEE